MKKIHIIVALTTMLAFLSAMGCGTKNAAEDKQTKDEPVKTEKQSKPDSTEMAETESVTGVEACDEYLSKVEFCLTKPNVPEAAKTAYRQSLEQNRAAWKQLAATEQGKASLQSSCKMALDSAKTFFDSCQ
jgi:hypothetical protein